MEQSIARIEHWFEGQTGDQALRIDTYKGTPDITFVRLPHSDAQAEPGLDFKSRVCEQSIRKGGAWVFPDGQESVGRQEAKVEGGRSGRLGLLPARWWLR
jgi:hypothetical protein